MCIRDRDSDLAIIQDVCSKGMERMGYIPAAVVKDRNYSICLLYTSDAADERSSVDLGGRRIIKKKTDTVVGTSSSTYQQTRAADINQHHLDNE